MQLLNGYVHHNSGYNIPQYKKEGNKILLRGMVRNDTTTDQYIANLPVGYRPKNNVYLSAVKNDGFVPIVISPDGNIICYMYRKSEWLDFGEIQVSLD